MCLSVDHSGQFALNEVDGFIVLGVDVDRRLRVSAADVFEEAKLAIGLLAGAGASSPRRPKTNSIVSMLIVAIILISDFRFARPKGRLGGLMSPAIG